MSHSTRNISFQIVDAFSGANLYTIRNALTLELAPICNTMLIKEVYLRSLHSNVPTPPRSSLHNSLSSGLPPSHLSQRTPTNLHTPKFSSRQSSRLRDRISISSTHRNGGVSFFGPITALHARHKRTLLCRELSLITPVAANSCQSPPAVPRNVALATAPITYDPTTGAGPLKRSIITRRGLCSGDYRFSHLRAVFHHGPGPVYQDGNGLARHRLLPETLLSLTTATIQLQQLHRSLHSNVPTPPRSSLHTTLSSGLPPSHLSQRTPTNLHTPKFSSRQSSRLRDRISISSTHRNGGVSFFGPITALHARHKRTLLCRELRYLQTLTVDSWSHQYNIRTSLPTLSLHRRPFPMYIIIFHSNVSFLKRLY
ncbi:unnamed protein product [Acanthosepion pharaonis]|uniref:Uncharacterized protein n=1 Tax=Acanthosepion pharaonis TaxID=158019 RepID=A0A812C718_ACAPH|nr:unnamed protein product [Sepia pharaonis]